MHKTCSMCKQEKPHDDFHKNSKNKLDGLQPRCKECKAVWFKYKYENDSAFREKHDSRNKLWWKLNKELSNEKQRIKRAANPTLYKALTNKRRAIFKSATPSWANRFFIEEAYKLAQIRTKMFGFQWHVDHVVPLNGETVCGLHVETNLQVIPGRENILKRNSWN